MPVSNGDGSLAVSIVKDGKQFVVVADIAGRMQPAEITPFKSESDAKAWLADQINIGGLPPNTRLYDTEGKLL